MSLEEIKKFMLNKLAGEKNYDYNNGLYYDEDGHCSSTLYKEIIDFWNGFDEDDFIYLVSGEYVSDLDLNGGRSYLLPEELANMCFEYLVNNLDYTLEKFEKCIYNTTEINEIIEDLFTDKSYIREIKIKEILKKV